MISIVHSDCIDYMSRQDPGYCDVVFADPPDNIGLKYDGFDDHIENYDIFVEDFIDGAMRIAKRGMWISFNSRHTILFASAVAKVAAGSWTVTPCVQTITFGNQRTKPGLLTNNHRPLWYISHGPAGFEEVREPSWRQLNGDKRADPRGKLVGDVFDFPRVTGNSKQRRKWHKTQLNEDLVERCLLLTTVPGDTVMDIFSGTGTTGRVCQKIGRKCVLVETSSSYVMELNKEFGKLDVKEPDKCLEFITP
jgi:DNA modification methylase